jgi:hypothetical protein
MTFPDIQVVSADFVQGSFTLLPLAGERARGALFFADQLDASAKENRPEKARRYFRAALSEFRSIFDLLNSDLRSKEGGLANQWEGSQFKSELDAHPLIAVLRKVRDFAVHSSQVAGVAKDFVVTVLGQGDEHQASIPSLYIDSLDKTRLHRELSYFSDVDIEWFNRQTALWPAYLLVQEAVFQTSVPLRNFLVTRRRDAV